MNEAPEHAQHVLIVAPVGQDAPVMSALLKEHGYETAVCASTLDACRRLAEGAGMLLMTEEALERAHVHDLLACLKEQPAWSELPLVVLTSGGESRYAKLLTLLHQAAGSVTLLERPLGAVTLLQSVDVALRSRRRQYQVRDLLSGQRENEERLRVALEGAELGSWDVDLLTGRAVWTRRHAEFLGFGEDAGPATLEHWRDRMHVDDRERVMLEIERARRERGFINVEHRLHGSRPDAERWLALYGRFYYNEAGDAVRLSGVSRDITREKSIAVALESSEQRFRQLTEAIPQLVWTCAADGRYEYVSTQWTRYTGQRIEQALDYAWLDAVHPDDRADLLARWHKAVQNATTFDAEVRLRSAGGEYRWFKKRAVLVPASGELILRWFGTSTDITDLVAAREAQRELAERLRQADRRKDVFLATLSHELRNPLAPIRNAAEVLASRNARPEQLTWATDVIRRQVSSLDLLLEDLLDLARITRGKLRLRTQRCLLTGIVDEAVETARPFVDRKNHKLTVDLPATPVTLDADPLRIAQALSNLLTNAAKYTDPGGHIEVRAQMANAAVALSVADDGIGIPADSLDRIFEMFSQGEQGGVRAEGGLGIGLALVKGLVEIHGGRVEARSDGIGKGSQFTIYLPVCEQREEGPVRQPGPHARPDGHGLRVLIADDNEDAANTLAMLLSLEGHDVRVAHEGRTALSVAQAFHPDVALLDIGMPDMDGYLTARELKREPWGAQVRVIAITGRGLEEDRQRSSEAGFAAHLTKPVDPTRLMELLKRTQPVHH